MANTKVNKRHAFSANNVKATIVENANGCFLFVGSKLQSILDRSGVVRKDREGQPLRDRNGQLIRYRGDLVASLGRNTITFDNGNEHYMLGYWLIKLPDSSPSLIDGKADAELDAAMADLMGS